MSSHPQEPSCNSLQECAPYVLGALDEREAQVHGAHLAECPICRADVAELQLAADSLALGVPRAMVPSRLRARVMGSAHAEVGQRGAPVRKEPHAGSARVRWAPRLRPVLVGVLALGVGLLIGALAFNPEPNQTTTEVIRAIVVAPGHHATAELRKAGSHVELIVVGMPFPPPGRIYQVWLEHGAEAPEATDALFSVTRTGSGSVGVPGDLRGVSKVLVTAEPLGGSLKPTRTPVIVGSV
jgi:hypothetical protein